MKLKADTRHLATIRRVSLGLNPPYAARHPNPPEKWVPAFSLRSSRNDVALAPHPEEQQSRVSKDGLVHNGVTLDSSFRWKCGLRELNVNFNTHVSCESTSPAP